MIKVNFKFISKKDKEKEEENLQESIEELDEEDREELAYAYSEELLPF